MADPLSGAFAAIAAAATSATVAVTGSAALAAAVGNAIIGAGAFLTSWNGALLAANIAASMLLAPDVNRGGSPTEWRPDPEAGFPVVLGRAATAGSIIHMDEHGPDNRYLTIANLLSAGQVDAIESFKADRVAVSFSGTGATSPAEYADKMWLSVSTGASATALSVGSLPHGASSLAGWGSNSSLPGLSHTLWTLFQDSKFKSYPQGAPTPLHVLRGVKIYDPRKDSTYPGGSGAHRLDDPTTWEFSRNPGLHAIAWALGHKITDPNTGKVFRIGIGCTASGLHWPAFIELANVCDANGWEVSAVPTSVDSSHQVLKAILQAGGARYSSLAGRISCIARTPRSSVVTVSAADTAGPFEIDVNTDRLTRRNTIRPRCVQEDHDWQMTPQDAVSVPEFVTADGGELGQSLDFAYVAVAPGSTNAAQPAELAAYAMLDSREPIIGTVPFKPHMAQLEPGDPFTMTEPGFLLDGVKLICLQRTINAVDNIVQISFISETDGTHEFALGRTNTPPTPPGLTAPDIRQIDPPAVDAFAVAALPGNNPGFVFTGIADNDAARGFIVEWRPANNPATGQPWAGAEDGWTLTAEYDIATTRVTLPGLEPNTVYDVRIRYVNTFGIAGTPRNLGTVTTGALVADDATKPSQDFAELLAGLDADATTALEAAQALIDAVKEVGSDPADVREALASAKTRLDAARAVADDAQIRTERLEPAGGNLIFDPALRLGPTEFGLSPGSQPFTTETPGGRALLLTFDASAGGETIRAPYRGRRRAVAGERIEVSAEMDAVENAENLRVELVSYDAGGAAISTQALSLADGYVRAHAFFTLPATTAEMEWRYAAEAVAAGGVEATARKPVWRKAGAGQVDPTAYDETLSDTLSAIVSERIASARAVSDTLRLVLQNADIQAKYESAIVTQLGADSALVGRVNTLEVINAGLTARIDTLEEVAFDGDLTAFAQQIDSIRISADTANAVRNSDLVGGPDGWGGTPEPPRDTIEDAKRALLWAGPAAASGEVARWRFADPYKVRGGQRLEISAALKASGVATGSVAAVWFDESDTEGATLSLASAAPASFTRVGSFAVIAPADGFLRIEIVTTASGAGAGRLLATEFVVATATAAQTSLTPYRRVRGSVETQFLERKRVEARQASTERHLIHEAVGTNIRISEEATLRAAGDQVQAQRSTQIEAAYQAADAAKASIISVDTAIAGVNGAIATQATTLRAEFAAADASLQSQVSARATITLLNQTVATETSARASALAALEADLQGQVNARATVTQLNTAIATEQSARASAVTSLQTTINGVSGTASTALSIAQSANGKIASRWGVLFDANGRVTSAVLFDNGTTRGFNLAVDVFTVEGVQPFSYNSQTGVLTAPNLVATNIAADVITATQIVSGSLGVRKKDEAANHFLVPAGTYANGPAAQAAFSNLSLETANQSAKAGDQVEIQALIYIEAGAGLFNHFYYRIRLLRLINGTTSTVIGGGVVLDQNGYINHTQISQNARTAKDKIPQNEPIILTDTLPGNVPASATVRYELILSPRNVQGASSTFENWGDSAGTLNLVAKRAHLSARLFSAAFAN